MRSLGLAFASLLLAVKGAPLGSSITERQSSELDMWTGGFCGGNSIEAFSPSRPAQCLPISESFNSVTLKGAYLGWKIYTDSNCQNLATVIPVLPATQKPNILARVSHFANPISSSAFAIRQSVLDDYAEEELLVRFLSAMCAANLYLRDPTKQKCSISAIEKQLNVSTTAAQFEYTTATNYDTGEVRLGGDFTVNEWVD
ncbi:hypothetical protein B7463_g830, partial [Scytalidium lignicola]